MNARKATPREVMAIGTLLQKHLRPSRLIANQYEYDPGWSDDRIRSEVDILKDNRPLAKSAVATVRMDMFGSIASVPTGYRAKYEELVATLTDTRNVGDPIERYHNALGVIERHQKGISSEK